MVVPRLRLFLAAFIASARFVSIASAACYFPDGTLSPNDTPCEDESEHALCCGQGYACLSNRICQATGEELQKPGATEFVRGGCTDKTYRSSKCPSFCSNPEVDNVSGGMGMWKCDNTDKDMYYCINLDRDKADCENGVGVLFFPGTPSALTTIGVAPTSSVKTSTTSIETTTSSEPTTSASSEVTTSAEPTTSASSEVATSAEPTTSISLSPTATSPTDTAQGEGAVGGTSSKGSSSPSAAVIGGSVAGGVVLIIICSIACWWIFKKRRQREGLAGPSATGPTADQIPQGGFYNDGKSSGLVYGNPVHIYEAPGSLPQGRYMYQTPGSTLPELPGTDMRRN